jgi:hypothetical protein
MRTVPGALVTASLQDARIVSSRVVVTDNRLRFNNLNKLSNDEDLFDGAMKSHDSAGDGSAIYRVANVNNTLYYMVLTNPGGSWPGSWTNSGRSLMGNSRPGVFESRVFYQVPAGSIKYADFSGSSLGSEQNFKSLSTSDVYALAPVSSGSCVYRQSYGPTALYADMGVMKPATYTFDGSIYGNTDLGLELFDAEIDENGWTYVFWSEEGGKRIKFIKTLKLYEPWSDIQDLIPMDVVDDLNQFNMGGVTRLGSVGSTEPYPLTGSLFVGGGMVRTDLGDMQMYTMGPPWTMGRDIFVGTDGTEERTSGGKDAPIAGGKMHFIGSKVYYIGPGIAYEADGVDWTGDTSPSVDIDNIHSASVSQELNNSDKFVCEIPYSTSHAALKNGSDVEWYVSVTQEGVSPTEVKMGTYNIDAILDDRDESGKTKTIVARSRSAKAIQVWKPDTSYDYWGSDAKIADPIDLSEIVRLDSHWNVDTGRLVNESMNDVFWPIPEKYGAMYSLARPSRGGMVQVKVSYDNDTNFDPIFGVLMNYYHETKEQAAERLGYINWKTITVPWHWYGRNYLFFGWGPYEHSTFTAPGFTIRSIHDGDWSTLHPALWTSSFTIPTATDYWIMGKMAEGFLVLYYRAASSNTWIRAATINYKQDGSLPWERFNQVGRMGLFVHNEISYIDNLPHNSNSPFLPFRSKIDHRSRSLPVPDIYIVNEEQYYVTAIQGTAANNSGLVNVSQECFLWPNDGQPKDNPGFTPPINSYPIWGDSNGNPGGANYYDDMVLVITDGPGTGNVYEIADGGFDYDAPRQWVPNGGIYFPTDPDWIDHVGDPAHGAWGTSNFWRVYVKEDPRGAVRAGSQWMIAYKGVCTRGYNDTLITSHPDNLEKVNLYTTARARVDEFNAFTNEREWNMEEMITEIARKAGVREVTTAKIMDGEYNRSTASWALDSQMSSYGQKQANTVIHARPINTSGKVGVQFDRTPSWTGGYVAYIEVGIPGNAVLMEEDGTILEKIPLGNAVYDIAGSFTFSVQKDHVKIFQQGQLVAGFKLPQEIDSQSWSGPAFQGGTFDYYWPELSMRIDNYILDIGVKGSSLINKLIGQKRIYWKDDQDGNLYLFRERVTVNSGSPYTLAHVGGDNVSESEIATRVRVEGAEAAMAIDEAALREHGNIFMVANAEDVMTTQDAIVEAEWLLGELKRRSSLVDLQGACDPRVEAGDIIEVTFPEGDIDVVVDNIRIGMIVTESDAQFDMTISGHNGNA